MHKIQFYHNRNIKQYQSWYSKNNRKFFHIPLRFEQALSLNKICVWPDRRSVVNCAVLVPASWCQEALGFFYQLIAWHWTIELGGTLSWTWPLVWPLGRTRKNSYRWCQSLITTGTVRRVQRRKIQRKQQLVNTTNVTQACMSVFVCVCIFSFIVVLVEALRIYKCIYANTDYILIDYDCINE